MAKLDTWNPSETGLREDEIELVVANIAPTSQEAQKSMDDLLRAKRYVDATEHKQGQCNFCAHVTPRDFCSQVCETKAAFATMGKSLKFHK